MRVVFTFKGHSTRQLGISNIAMDFSQTAETDEGNHFYSSRLPKSFLPLYFDLLFPMNVDSLQFIGGCPALNFETFFIVSEFWEPKVVKFCHQVYFFLTLQTQFAPLLTNRCLLLNCETSFFIQNVYQNTFFWFYSINQNFCRHILSTAAIFWDQSLYSRSILFKC